MTGPRSTRLFAGEFPVASYWAVVLCPAGHTIIVKEVAMYNATADTVVINVVLQNPTMTYPLYLARASIVSGGMEVVSVNTVMQPSDQMNIQTSNGPTTYWISGTFLQGVSEYPQLPAPNQLPALPLIAATATPATVSASPAP